MRIRIRTGQKHADPADPDPKPWYFYKIKQRYINKGTKQENKERVRSGSELADADPSIRIRNTVLNPFQSRIKDCDNIPISPYLTDSVAPTGSIIFESADCPKLRVISYMDLIQILVLTHTHTNARYLIWRYNVIHVCRWVMTPTNDLVDMRQVTWVKSQPRAHFSSAMLLTLYWIYFLHTLSLIDEGKKEYLNVN